MKDVPDRLIELANIFKDRNKSYKDNYRTTGSVIKSMFPDGVFLRTEEEFNRFYLYVMLIHKMTRAFKTFPSKSHDDSLDDLAVYSQLLRDYDDSLNS